MFWRIRDSGSFRSIFQGADTPSQVWLRTQSVTAGQVTDSDYDEVGLDALLGPKEALKWVHPEFRQRR